MILLDDYRETRDVLEHYLRRPLTFRQRLTCLHVALVVLKCHLAGHKFVDGARIGLVHLNVCQRCKRTFMKEEA